MRFERRDRRRYIARSRYEKDTKLQCRSLAVVCLVCILVLLLLLQPRIAPVRESKLQDPKPWRRGAAPRDYRNSSVNEAFSKRSKLVGNFTHRVSTENGEDHQSEDPEAEQQRNVSFDEKDVCDRSRYPRETELIADKITILINGFSESRLELLQQNIQVYSALPFVHSVYVLWGNTSSPENFLQDVTFTSYGAPIYLVRQTSRSLNDRFLPRTFINTTAVLICDDDITIESKSLEFAVGIWRDDPGRIVGFFPRSHAFDYETKSWLYIRHQTSYSIILTKMMILSTEFLYLYTCTMPAGVKEYIDSGMNCEDIAMNFLVSSHSLRGPMLVEGTARDWGDPRNSAVEKQTFRDSALSGRKGHRKDRGACITAFEKYWNGMKLQFTHSRASPNLENEIHCEKFGYIMDCDTAVASKRDARRQIGEQMVSIIQRFAYVTFVSSDRFLNSSLLLAQSLRSTGTIHDLVLMLNYQSCDPISESHVLHDHFDEVVNVSLSTGASSPRDGKLRAWLLLDYVKVVYIEADSLVLANIDHLFRLPETAAAPRVFMPDKFSTGLLVLKPSNETYTSLSKTLEKGSLLAEKSISGVLDSFFSRWFERPAEYRLPVRYNVPAVFPDGFSFPSWFQLNRLDDVVGPLMVVRYGNAKLELQDEESNCVFENRWCLMRARLLQTLLSNNFLPLEEGEEKNWLPQRIGAFVQERDSILPPHPFIVSATGESAMATSRSSNERQAFVTVLDGSQKSASWLVGWAESFHHHHTLSSRTTSLLLLRSDLDPLPHSDFLAYFDEYRLVDPFLVYGKPAHHSFTLLHLWNQTDFDKLVFVAPNSIFVDNCYSLLEYSPFAAVPSLFPPDTFSTQVMSLRPDQQMFEALQRKLSFWDLVQFPVERFLNSYYTDWYQSSTAHRISPVFAVNVPFLNYFQQANPPRKILSFSLEWLPDQKKFASKLWEMHVCSMQPRKNPDLVRSLCGDPSPTGRGTAWSKFIASRRDG